MTWQRQCRKAGAELGGAAERWEPLATTAARPSCLSLHTLCGTRSELQRARHNSDPSGWGKRGERSPVYFSFCYFISLQWEQLRMSRISENNCWASVQVVNKEPQTLLSPTTKRCWHKKNSIFLCRNHLLNSLVLNRIPCLLPLLFPQNLKTNHTKISYSSLICYIRCFLRNPAVLSPRDVSVRSCLRRPSLETQYEYPPPPSKIILWSWVKCRDRYLFSSSAGQKFSCFLWLCGVSESTCPSSTGGSAALEREHGRLQYEVSPDSVVEILWKIK